MREEYPKEAGIHQILKNVMLSNVNAKGCANAKCLQNFAMANSPVLVVLYGNCPLTFFLTKRSVLSPRLICRCFVVTFFNKCL